VIVRLALVLGILAASGPAGRGQAPSTKSFARDTNASPWWSLRPVARITPPPVDGASFDWVRTEIDAFIAAKLSEKNLAPSSEADRRTLIRRLTFDLHGLPPTPDEIDAFLADSSPHAYEKVVDRLLDSPRYGERWAQHWMDLAHYAETHGHDQDVPRENAWPYRDYLITSLNADKPYRRFIEEQIAGDILYPDDPLATVALGFLAAGPWDESSLRDIREDSIDRKAGQYLDRDDIVGTVGLTFLSTTVQCARCHNHKFDPVSQKEYFGLQAIFAGVDRANRSYDLDPAVHRKRVTLESLKKSLQSGGSDAAKLVRSAIESGEVAAWERSKKPREIVWRTLDPKSFTSTCGADLVKLPDQSLLASGPRPERDVYTIDAVVDGSPIAAVRLEVLSDASLPLRGPGRQENGNLHLTEFRVEASPLDEPAKKRLVPIARAVADFNQDGWDIAKAIDGRNETAWGIFPAVGQSHHAVFLFKEPVQHPGGTRLTITLEQNHGRGHLIGRPRLSVTSDRDPFAAPLPPAISAILSKPATTRTQRETTELARYVLVEKTDADLAALPVARFVYAATANFAPEGSFRPANGCRPVHLLRRGDIKQPQELALPGALAAIRDVPFHVAKIDNEGERRAALARWVADPRNPLTWRSIVNRVWHYHFGRGLVSTPSDFGKMGATPSHPELLDWLTTRFVDDGASLKSLHRRIVMSATYRQSSRFRPDAAKIDGDNVFLWRMNAQRLDAEAVRDAMLLVAGKLDSQMGGPSVKRFAQSPGIHRTPKVDYQAFDPDAPGAHRRSVYRFIFRTLPDPFMDALDCPDASQFTAARTTSITALQALAMLNDPFVVRMSEHFAKRIADAGSPADQCRLAYRLALGREPAAHESDRLNAFAERHGMANACRLLLNCNEFVFVP
jgi:hypothetical protein